MYTFALALVAATATARSNNTSMFKAGSTSNQRGFSYGSGHGTYAVQGEYHKNPWEHNVVTNTIENGYHRDPFETRDSASATRSGWYSPYQQFSPPQIRYKPSVSHAIFAQCTFTGLEEFILFAQLPGKAIVYKRNFCNTGNVSSDFDNEVYEDFFLQIQPYGYEDYDESRELGDEYNPLKEVDKNGRQNPYQDPNRGRILNLSVTQESSEACPGAADSDFTWFGTEDKEPLTLLQNLEGPESIMGRGICIITVDDITASAGCCIVARTPTPAGYGPKPVPYPMTTHQVTYNSYGKNYAEPLPYHKRGYQATAMAEDYPSQVGRSIYGTSGYGGY